MASIWLKRLTVSGILIKASNTQKSTKIRAKKISFKALLEIHLFTRQSFSNRKTESCEHRSETFLTKYLVNLYEKKKL